MPLVFSYGPELVERVAVCSGGGARYLGVRALAAKLAEEFGVEWEFIDLPNPV